MDSFRKSIEESINIYTSLYSCLRNSSSIPPRTFSVVSQIQQPIFPWGLKEGKKNSSKKFDDQSTVVYFETQRKAPLTKKKSGGSIKGRNSFLENVDKFLEFFSRTTLFYFLTVVVETKLISFVLSLDLAFLFGLELAELSWIWLIFGRVWCQMRIHAKTCVRSHQRKVLQGKPEALLLSS